MKALVSFENRIRPDSTGVYIINAFRNLGHTVDHVLPENILTVTGGYDLYCKVDDGLRETIWNKNLHPSYYIAIDTHIEYDWRIKLANEGRFDAVSVTHSSGLSLPWGRNDVFWNPVGCDPNIHYVGLKEKKYDGCFIGNFHNSLAARRVDMLDTFFKNTPVFFFGSRIFREMTEKYAESKLIFNCAINGDCNMRVFEALCSGSCLVTDRVADIEKLGFVDKSHYFGYSSKEELAELTQMLLRENGLRERVAKNGRQEVIANHTYANRMKFALEKLNLNNLNAKEKVCL